MASQAQSTGWQGPSRRRSARYRLQAPLDVTVLRSGIPETVPGRSVNVCERGIAAMVAGEIKPGEVVGIELHLPMASDSLRSRAMVRYQDQLRCGMEFVGLSGNQQAAIRDWVNRSKAEFDAAHIAAESAEVQGAVREAGRNTENAPLRIDGIRVSASGKGSEFSGSEPPGPPRRGRKRSWAVWLAVVVILAFLAGVLWWRWNRGWQELEAGLEPDSATAEKAQLQVPTEVMERLLVHKVDPLYPAQARRHKVEGVIVLDIIVGHDGSVIDVHPQNGPEVLARPAMEAVRWWKFEPYRLNGEPAVVGTRVAVEFKP